MSRPATRPRRYDGPTYYEMPAVRAAPWTWHVPAYVFLGGTGGGAAVIGAAARVAWGRDGKRATTLAGAPLLVADLKTPQRWFNMLRIARPTSPMSIGSYTLTGFGAFTTLGAITEWARDRISFAGPLADAMCAPAAALGAMMTTYTATLLSATSVPVWAAEPRLLAIRYASSSLASGAAALSLAATATGYVSDARALDRIGGLCAAATLAASLAADRKRQDEGLDAAYRGTRTGRMHKLALALYALPLACHVANDALPRRSRLLSLAAALATLGASFLSRNAAKGAGPESARRPRDYFQFAAPPPEAGPPAPRTVTPPVASGNPVAVASAAD